MIDQLPIEGFDEQMEQARIESAIKLGQGVLEVVSSE